MNKLIGGIVVIFLAYVLLVNPVLVKIEIKSNYPKVTIEERVITDKFKGVALRAKPTGMYEGVHTFSNDFWSREPLTISYYFDTSGGVAKRVIDKSGGVIASGYAKFVFDGSVMMFSEVTGDKVLFSQAGEAITTNENAIDLHIPDGHITLNRKEN